MEKDAAPPPCVVTHESGVRFSAEVRGHRIVTDQPPTGGGEDSAPMPLELFGAALGSCVALYVVRFCQTRGIPTEGLRVETVSLPARDPYRLARFDVRVTVPAGVPEHYRGALERAARSCPAHATLVLPADVSITLDAGALETAGAQHPR